MADIAALADWTRWRTRFVLFTGKGGVGKTTITAATAVAAADERPPCGRREHRPGLEPR